MFVRETAKSKTKQATKPNKPPKTEPKQTTPKPNQQSFALYSKVKQAKLERMFN